MHLQFRHIEPHFLLKKYIDKMWLFESSGKMPEKKLLHQKEKYPSKS